MFLEALLVGLVVAACFFTNYMTGYTFTDRPIIVGTLVGLVLGDLSMGIICGASAELVFLGLVNVGSVPSDVTNGTAIATAFVILTGMELETAITLAVPAGLLMAQLQTLVFTLRSFTNPWVDKWVENGEVEKIGPFLFGGQIIYSLLIGSCSFLVMLLGAEAVTNFMNSIPPVITGGLGVATGCLAAVGFGLLLKMMWSKSLAVYYFIGFVLAAYFHLPVLGIAICGVLWGFVLYTLEGRDKKTVVVAKDEEVLFDD